MVTYVSPAWLFLSGERLISLVFSRLTGQFHTSPLIPYFLCTRTCR